MRRAEILKRILLVIGGIVLGFIVLEIGLRVAEVLVTTVQRARNRQSASHGGEYRILCLGESTTAGQWPQFLAEYLFPEGLGPPIVVFDEGKAGTDSALIVSGLPELLTRYQPHLVVCMMGINDPIISGTATVTPTWVSSLRSYKLIALLCEHIKTPRVIVPESVVVDEPKQEVPVVTVQHTIIIQAAKSLIINNRFDEAISMLKDAVERYPHDYDLYWHLSTAYIMNDQSEQAIVADENFLAHNPDNIEITLHLIELLIACGKHHQAQEAIMAAVAKFPGQALLLDTVLEHVQFLQGSYAVTDRPITQQSTWPDRRLARNALCLFLQNRTQEAHHAFDALTTWRIQNPSARTRQSYQKMQAMLHPQGVDLLCVQYPVRSLLPLKKIMAQTTPVFFWDNEATFKDALLREGYTALFRDNFAGDFGHCTERGNRLLARRIAEVIIEQQLISGIKGNH